MLDTGYSIKSSIEHRASRILFIFFSHFLITVTPLSADTVLLKNGNEVQGIVVEEDEEKVVLQFEKEATVQFSRSEIEKIVYDSEEVRTALRSEWGKMSPPSQQPLPSPPPSPQASQIIQPITSQTKEAQTLLAEGEWEVRKTQHFTIYYQNTLQGKAISNRAEYYLEKIVDDLRMRRSHDWRKKFTVYVVSDEAQWRRFLEGLGIQPELTGGFETGIERREIFLYSLSISYLQLAFPHELTHLLLDELARGKKFPLWFDEGFANYEGGIIGIDEDFLQEAIRIGREIPLKELITRTTYPTDPDQKKLFYTEAERLVEFFITQYGRRRFAEFTKQLLAAGDFEQAFQTVYGGKIGGLERLNELWLRYLSE